MQTVKEEKKREEVMARCRKAAFRLLTVRARSRAELGERLAGKGYASSVIEETLAELERSNLIGDRQFARAWVESRLKYRPCGASKLRWELRRKGIDDKLAAAAIEEALEETSEFEMALELARVRWEKRRPAKDKEAAEETKKEAAKMCRFLSGRGFSYSVIRQVINKLKGAETENEP